MQDDQGMDSYEAMRRDHRYRNDMDGLRNLIRELLAELETVEYDHDPDRVLALMRRARAVL